MKNFQNNPVLIIGSGDIEKIAVSTGLNHYITIDEFGSLYPHLVKINKRPREDMLEVRKRIMKRLNISSQFQYKLLKPI